MRRTGVAIPVAILAACLLAAAPAAAQLAGPTLTHPSSGAPQKKAPAPDKAAKTCPEYGAGYVRVEATGSCVKIGGYVRMQGSVSGR
jgi:hypothetical protein